MTTIFSRIVAGEIPSAAIYEDELTFAFLDISPASVGHALVICKHEHTDLLAVPPETLAAVAQTTQRVARAIMTVLQPDGITVVQNNGAAAGQTVFHYHVHVIPRHAGDGVLQTWVPQPAEATVLADLAAQLRTSTSAV